MSHLLSRYAEGIFWLARYVERAENLARILDVTQTFNRDSRGSHDWRTVLRLYDDEARFAAAGNDVSADAVLHFYLLDAQNPGSVVSCLRLARENARTLRPYISTEMWTQLNVFHNGLRELDPAQAGEREVNRLCAMIKEACQTHTGITEGTFFRDEGWLFYQLGRSIERADQTTRVLDVQCVALLTARRSGVPLEVGGWYALLRCVAGYQAYRRLHPMGMDPDLAAEFLLFNRSFPRSVLAQVAEINRRLVDLRSGYRLEHADGALAHLSRLRILLEANATGARSDAREDLHEFLDAVQRELVGLTEELGYAFFGLQRPPDSAAFVPQEPELPLVAAAAMSTFQRQ